jgi:hypothetical protein
VKGFDTVIHAGSAGATDKYPFPFLMGYALRDER